MYSAYNSEFKKISINDAVSGQTYLCPACRKKLFVKTGERKRPHFCHYPGESCIDYWHYDESEWSDRWKSSFSNDEVEIIHHEHHIDIEVKNNLGIMFSSSSMHRDTFIEKTDYMLDNINNAMWLFNLTDLYEKGTINPGRYSIIWRNIWKMFSDYLYTDHNVWVIIEITVKNVRWFGILKDIDRSYDDKTLYIRRWLKEEQFRKYFNDIADKKDPEQPYVEEEEKQRKLKEEAAEKARIERENQEAAAKEKREELERQRKAKYEALLQEAKEKEAALLQKQKDIEEKKQVALNNAQPKEREYIPEDQLDPQMKQMSDRLNELNKLNRYREFADMAMIWYKKYGFAWVYSPYNHEK